MPLAVCGGAAPNAARAEAELIAGLGGAEGVWRAALRHAGVARAAEAELLEIIAEESAASRRRRPCARSGAAPTAVRSRG